jgi:glutamate/tyrosine decarboxylase-like PLP-dependent enzyme
VLDVLRLPTEASVGFVTGATVANFVCLAAARSEVLRRVDWDVEADGLFGAPPVTVLIGADAHATVFSGLKYLGMGAKRVVTVDCDALGRIVPQAFAAAVAQIDGPAIAVLQAGQINTGGCDPFAEIVPMARARGVWTHVDGAFGLWAQAAPARRHLPAGVELADSWATDGHKWLQTPYDCGFAIVRDAEAHRSCLGRHDAHAQSRKALCRLRQTEHSRSLPADRSQRDQPDPRKHGGQKQRPAKTSRPMSDQHIRSGENGRTQQTQADRPSPALPPAQFGPAQHQNSYAG